MRWWIWLFFIPFIGYFLYAALTPYRSPAFVEKARRERDIATLINAWQLCNSYALQNDGNYPRSFDMNFLREAVDKGLLEEHDIYSYMLGGDHVETVGIYIVPSMTTTQRGSEALLVAIDEFSYDKDKNYIVVTVSGKAEALTGEEISQIMPYGKGK